MMPSEILARLIADHPYAVDWLAAVYCVGWLVGHAVRAGWPDEADRPRGIRIVLAVADACQLTFFAPIKALARKVSQ